jgi:hypothetical protein
MTDLFASTESAPAQPASPPAKGPLHYGTDLYRAVAELSKYVARATSNFRRDIKPTYGLLLVEESARMAVLVREAAIARGEAKLPYLDEVLRQLELIQFVLKTLDDMGQDWLPHKTYAASLPITASIGKQANALKAHFAAAS